MLSSIAQLNAMRSHFEVAGITVTKPDALPTIEQPTATATDVAQAILASKKSNPYSDPVIQTAMTEYAMTQFGAIAASQATLRDQHQVAHARAQLPNILEQIEAQFEQTAEDLQDAHKALGGIQDLSTVDLNSAAPRTADAALKATRAIARMNALVTLQKRIHRLHTGQGNTDAADVYLRGNPDLELLLQYKKNQAQFTVWDQVLDGVAFELATPAEAQKRYTEAQQEHERDKRPRVSYLR